MAKFKVGDRVDHVGPQQWSKDWQNCEIMRLPIGKGLYYDVRNPAGSLGLLAKDEIGPSVD